MKEFIYCNKLELQELYDNGVESLCLKNYSSSMLTILTKIFNFVFNFVLYLM